MHKDLMAQWPRQQKMAFAVDEVWHELSGEVRGQCHERLVRLLEAVIQTERQARRKTDDRQDLC